jgi:phage protein U
MVGLYGPIFFTTGVVIDDMKKTVGARWGAHEIWQSKPVLEYAGASLIDLTFKMSLLKPFTVDPLGSIIALQEIMDLGTPLPLILGLFPMGRGSSLFIMESLEVEPHYFFQGGGIMGATCNVKLKEYPDPGLINTLKAALGGSGSTPSTEATAGEVKVGELSPDSGALPDSTVAEEGGGGGAPNLNQGPELVGQGADDIGGTTPAPTPTPTPQVPQTGSAALDATDMSIPTERLNAPHS